MLGHSDDPGKGCREVTPCAGCFLICPPRPSVMECGYSDDTVWEYIVLLHPISFLLPAFLSPHPRPSPSSHSFSPLFPFSFFASLFVPSASLPLCPCTSLPLSSFLAPALVNLHSAVYASYCQSDGTVVRNTNILAIFPFPPRETSSDCGF